jgi:hypothetical protein
MAPAPYTKYPVIKNGFSGENEEDLEDNISKYLNNLMAHINKPFVDCPTCEGAGVVLEKAVELQL